MEFRALGFGVLGFQGFVVEGLGGVGVCWFRVWGRGGGVLELRFCQPFSLIFTPKNKTLEVEIDPIDCNPRPYLEVQGTYQPI